MSLDTYRAPFKYDADKPISTDGSDNVAQAQIAHYNIPAASATAESDAGAMALTALGAAVASVTAGLTSPAVPRNVKADCSVAGVTSDVTVHGTNFADEAISEAITLNGVTAVAGSLAFKTITKVDLPIRTHTPAYQTETITVTHAVTAEASGNITMAITSTALGDASPKSVVVAVTDALDDVTKCAAAIVEALNADEDVSAAFLASNEAGIITLTALAYAANDDTLAFGFTDTGETGITCGSSTNGTSGVAEDKVSIGFGKKFGIPYTLTADELVIVKLFNNSADTGTVTPDDDELEKNVIALNGTPDGLNPIDLYIIV